MDIIKLRNVYKKFGSVQALNDLSMNVPQGSIYGFLGPNGSGKTTSIKILLGLIFMDQGTAECFGNPIPLVKFTERQKVGYVSDDFIVYPFLSGNEMVSLHAGLYGLPEKDVKQRAQAYAKIFNLPMNKKVRTYSKGMRKILLHILALSTNPDLLIIDEPTDGLDPLVRNHLIEIFIDHVSQRGMTLFFSSHILTEVERICDHVLFLKKGSALLETTMDDIHENYHIYSIRAKDFENCKSTMNMLKSVKTGVDTYDVDVFKPAVEAEKIFQDNGCEVLQKHSIPFENIFIRMMEENNDISFV
jgi:ABC-2 type transport system ATP-binding protein